MAMGSACGLLLPGIGGDGCTEEGCAVECEEYVLDENGCSTCECVEPEVTVCWDSSECASGQRCDSDNYCETPPGCTEDEPCPAVCYGRCVDDTTGCFSDADCDADERCRFPNTGEPPPGEPTEPGDGDEAAPAPPECPEDDPDCNDRVAREGICVDDGCDEAAIDLPACPPGTRPVYDDGNCGNIRCVEIDECRELDIDVCESVEGCEIIEVPGECNCTEPGEDGAPPGAEPCICDDGSQLVCAQTNTGCYGLSPEECSQRPDCEGYWTGVDLPAPEPCECEPGADCECEDRADPAPPPPEEFYCTDRRPVEGCRDSRDCGPNERCETTVVCTDDCYEAEDGSTGCLSECWEQGQCVETERSCYDLGEDECIDDPDCQLVDYGCDCAPSDSNCICPETPIAIQVVCEPRQRPSCESDDDCGEGERCEYEEFCPPCFDGSDPGCFAPCWAEGRCVEGGPEPERCTDNDQCGEGFVCETITVCEDFCGEDGARPAPPPDEEEDPIQPPPCENCYDEGRCVPENRPSECYFDEECGEGFFCDYYDDCVGPPDCVDCLVACAGQCRPTSVEPGYCLEDSDCGERERCAVEQDICFIDPNGNSNECFHECVPTETNEDICLEDSDCNEGQRCATELEVCICAADDPNCTVCYSQCVDVEGDCPQVVTGGQPPGSEQCEAFPTPCDVPEGYEECDLNGNQP